MPLLMRLKVTEPLSLSFYFGLRGRGVIDTHSMAIVFSK